MACKDCFSNCNDFVNDNCVKYTGDTIPVLGICKGDPVSKVEQVIIEKVLEFAEGKNIILGDINLETCPELLQILNGEDPTLERLISILWKNQCTLKELIGTSSPVSFNTACLSGLPENPTKDQILQAALNKICSMSSVVDSLPATYVKISDLQNLVQQIIQQNSETPSGGVQYKDRMPPNVALPYFGSLNNFDNTGKGISALGWDKVYLCNGSNGTPDLRGRTLVGAVRNIPGGALDTAVNPANPLNIAPVDYAMGDKFGENFVKLTTNEIPSHSHPVNDPGHRHTLPPNVHQDGNAAGGEGGSNEKAPRVTLYTTTNTTGISIGATGGGQAHNNRQPSIACAFIMYIP